MGRIHRAYYGERGGGHDLLSTSAPGLRVVREALGATDRPSAWSGNWLPYVSGMSLGTHYVLMRTFPAPSRVGGRGGFVFTHALFIERDDIATVSDLRALFGLLGTEIPTDTSVLDSFPSPGPVESPEFSSDSRARAAARQLLAGDGAGRPVVWLGEAGFEDLLARIWSGLWVDARMALRFRASFDPADTERGGLTLVCTPELSRARWAGFPVVEAGAAVEDVSLAELLLAGEPSPLSEFITEVKPQGAGLRILRQAEVAAELLRSGAELRPELHVRLLRLLLVIGPEAGIAAEEKARTALNIAAATSDADAEFTHSLRNLAGTPLGAAVEDLRNGVRQWVQVHFTGEAETIGSWVRDAAEAWWHQSVREGVELAVRGWARSVADALWGFWTLNPLEVEPLCALGAMHSRSVADDLAVTCPHTLALPVAEQLARVARIHCWPTVLGLSMAAAHGVHAAVEALLDAFSEHGTTAFDSLGTRYGGGALTASAVRFNDSQLTDVAARYVASEPAILSGVDPDDEGWRRVWLRAIQFGADPWAGVSEPRKVRDRILDRVLGAGDVDPALLSALARTPMGDLYEYPQRRDLWTVLPEPARSEFLAATAGAWVDRFRSSPDSTQVPEDAVVSSARAHPRLLEGSVSNPAGALHAGVAAFDRIPGWQEAELLSWFRHMRSALEQLSAADAERLGRFVGARRWRGAAADLYALRNSVTAIRAAFPAVLPLLNVFQQWILAFEGVPHGLHRGPDWYDALLELAVHLYPHGPEQQRIWERSGGDSSLIEGQSGRDRWRSAVHRLRSGGAGRKASARRVSAEMMSDFPDNRELRSLHEMAP